MFKKVYGYFSKGELILWGFSVTLIIVSFCIFGGNGFLTLAASLIGVTSILLNAKDNPVGQLLMIIFSLMYGIISYKFAYFGEMVTYLGMTMPMAVFALISWLRHPYRGKKSEVQVNSISKKETVLMFLTCEIVPVGCVLTMVGIGSEMNGGSVITNTEKKLKIGHVFGEAVYPRFSILNPEFTFTVPHYQMISGIYDIMSHILEQYFSGVDDNTSDYISEGLLRSLIHAAEIAAADPTDYEARSNIMWTATWALNTLIAKGKSTDWMVHMLGQAVGAYTNATHCMTLSAVSMPYYRYIMPYGTAKFARYAVNVWRVDPNGKTEREVAEEGLCRMESWMKKLGLVMNLTDLGVTPDMIDGIASATFLMDGGYKVLTSDEIKEILKASL